MSWLYLIVAGLLEVAWAVSMKSTEGFTRLGPTLLSLVLMGGSFYLLGLAMQELPTSSSYAVWVGIGAVLTVAFAMLTGGEAFSPIKALLLAGIVGCVIGLKLLH